MVLSHNEALEVEVFDEFSEASRAAASFIEQRATESIAERGRFVWAISGGSTPETMLRFLAESNMDWAKVHLFQVDERVAPHGHRDRNSQMVISSLLGPSVRQRIGSVHWMDVTDDDLDNAADIYSAEVAEAASGGFDVIQLGLGADGHTASLIPGDPAADERVRSVVVTASYQGRVRMTLTGPVLNRARSIVWLVSGAGKSEAFKRLIGQDPDIPAGTIDQGNAVAFVDRAVVNEIN